MCPSFYSDNQLQIGFMYLKMGKKSEAKEWFTKLLSYEAKTDEDRAKIAEAQKQLKSLQWWWKTDEDRAKIAEAQKQLKSLQ